MGNIVNVKNRSSSVVIYNLPEDGIRREIAPGETRQIDTTELEHLTYRPGGRELMQNYLLIEDIATVNQMSFRTEPEYWMKEVDIRALLTAGTLDEFLDCLDFAPQGVIDLVKDLAFKLPLNDSAKREALREKTGFDLDKALLNKRLEMQEDGVQPEEKPQRRVAKTSGRRTAGTNYKVVSTKED